MQGEPGSNAGWGREECTAGNKGGVGCLQGKFWGKQAGWQGDTVAGAATLKKASMNTPTIKLRMMKFVATKLRHKTTIS